jgi:uncharacterized protein YbcI
MVDGADTTTGIVEEQRQSPLAEMSRMAVQTMREYTGRGPTKARSTITEDLAVIVLRDTLLKAERTLVAAGESEGVLRMRRKFQETMREQMSRRVEEITGRQVVAFMSDNHVNPDIAVEMFIFASDDGDNPIAEHNGNGSAASQDGVV